MNQSRKRKYIYIYICVNIMSDMVKHVLETCLLSSVSRNQGMMPLLCSFEKEKGLIYLDHLPL